MATVLVLGATSDIGMAIAKAFAKDKCDLQLTARNKDQLLSAQADITIRYGVNCEIYDFDATDFTAHQRFYAALPVKPDVTVCVFGYMKDNETVIRSQKETLNTIATNFAGAVSILNIVAADYAAKKQGWIIGVSSVAGERGRYSNYIYGSAKAGFTAYLSGLRNRMYHEKVHVMTVLPGFVYTRMTEHLKLPKLLTATPDEVGKAVFKAVHKKKNIIYVKWFWRWIMLIIKIIPEFMFKKKKL